MKITSGHKLMAAALLAGTAQLSAAAEINNSPYAAVMGTYLFPDQDRQLHNGYGGTGVIGFPVGSYFAPEINVYGMRADRRYASGNDNIFGGGLNFVVYPFTRSPVIAPFLSIGGGAEYDKGGLVKPKTRGLAQAGGGFLIALNSSRSAALRLEAGRYAVFNDQYAANQGHVMDTRISAGVQISLGSNPEPAAPPPPPPPAPVAATPPPPPPPPPAAPKDSDGDGVLDNVDQCPNTPRGMKVDANGCAIKAATIVLHDITFATDKAVLTSEAKASLDNIVAGLKGQPSMSLQIDGHTDSTGSPAYNMKLSKQRAASAKQYLVENGIDASRLQSEGYGESKPIASNKTKAGRAENRRVEFKVLK